MDITIGSVQLIQNALDYGNRNFLNWLKCLTQTQRRNSSELEELSKSLMDESVRLQKDNEFCIEHSNFLSVIRICTTISNVIKSDSKTTDDDDDVGGGGRGSVSGGYNKHSIRVQLSEENK